MMVGQSAFSQSAANFNTSSIAPAASAPKGKAEAEAKPAAAPRVAGPVSNTPSRFVATAELEGYVASLTSVFSIQTRETDPFGQSQDPNAKPVIKTPVAKTSQRAPQVQATPFSEIIRRLVVTTIMPGEKRFLVGTRSIAQGERFPLTFRNKHIRVEVTEVTSRQIGFRNLDSGEIGSISLSLLPVGMTPGQNGITAPGMVPDRPDAPIELESGDPTTENP